MFIGDDEVPADTGGIRNIPGTTVKDGRLVKTDCPPGYSLSSNGKCYSDGQPIIIQAAPLPNRIVNKYEQPQGVFGFLSNIPTWLIVVAVGGAAFLYSTMEDEKPKRGKGKNEGLF